jgi:uncharacterized repeat protein (TIGR03899 family)
MLPIDKLLDLLSKSVGRVTKSYFDRKDVDARAYEIKKIAEARADEMRTISAAIKDNFKLTGGIEYSEQQLQITSPQVNEPQEAAKSSTDSPLQERMEDRVRFQQATKQLNIENITSFAAHDLKNEVSVTDEPIDDDWRNRFFKIAEDISNEEMQALWGKVLAGELKQPKSFSLRTLDALRNLAQNEANSFIRVAQFAVSAENSSFVLANLITDPTLTRKFHLTYSDILLMQELGFLLSTDVEFEAHPDESPRGGILKIGEHCLIHKIKPGAPRQTLIVRPFSKVGRELLRVIQTTSDMEYIKLVASELKTESVTVSLGIILKENGDNVKVIPLGVM